MALTHTAGVKLLKEFRYTTDTDVNMRLKGTILRYGSRPVYVSMIMADLSVQLVDLTSLTEFLAHSSDEALDISSVPVGWCNSHNGTVYLMRTARNSQKQGVTPQSLQAFMPGRGTDHFHFSGIEQLKPLAKMIDNSFPTPVQISRAPQGGAFDRDWALSNPNWRSSASYFILYHKTIPVGTFFAKTKVFFFRRGRLTKVRRASLENILRTPDASKEGPYAIQEQL